MKNRIFGMALILGIVAPFCSEMVAAAPIRVVGPKGEVISYQRKGGEIIVRHCEKNTTGNEVDKEDDCTVVREVKMSEKDFRALIKAKLSTLAKDNLSEEQKTLLEKALTDSPNLDEDVKRLAELKKQFEKNQSFKKENPNDYDADEEKTVQKEIDCVECRLKQQEEIINSKKEIATLIEALISDMEGRTIKRVVQKSEDGVTSTHKSTNLLE